MARLSRAERRKDVAQEMIESGTDHVGRIAGIITGAVREVTRELGEFATDVFEIREASRQAERDEDESPSRR